jgi:subtilase-type serine protease
MSTLARPRSRRTIALLTGALMLGVASKALAQVAPPAPYVDPGKLGDPDSWKTDESKSDWGLATINAQYAYALGITGAGIRLGDFDTGLLRPRTSSQVRANTFRCTRTVYSNIP